MTQPEREPVDEQAAERERARERMTMDYPVDLEWPTGHPDEQETGS